MSTRTCTSQSAPAPRRHDNVLITGAGGIIGRPLVDRLRTEDGVGRIVATDVSSVFEGSTGQADVNARLDVLNFEAIRSICLQYNVTQIVHLAALLSNGSRLQPFAALSLNTAGTTNVMRVAHELGISVFVPSSIAAFGADAATYAPESPLGIVRQHAPTNPVSLYGITKVFGERVGEYLYDNLGVDVRAARFPGVLSSGIKPSGGTTDYATAALFDALETGSYECYLKPATTLDFALIDDVLNCIVQMLNAKPTRLRIRTAYNVTGFSSSPELFADEVRKHVPKFKMTYRIDPARQAIAESWPRALDDSYARADFDWNPAFDLPRTVETLLTRIDKQLSRSRQLVSSARCNDAESHMLTIAAR